MLKERCQKMIDELGITVSRFTANAGIGRTTYYRWQNGELEISDNLKSKIDNYLKRYNF